jgi:hypothetical protein
MLGTRACNEEPEAGLSSPFVHSNEGADQQGGVCFAKGVKMKALTHSLASLCPLHLLRPPIAHLFTSILTCQI